ncbi:polysaccharide pyruvyl transferase family protein [Sphingomonas adhaesiva]|uniref:polysaccharide pyruvyl transferase family protein n=1 Tax=Sphingomonas adhaesiva TaxID=28212 RepID=UPI002FF9216B
MKLLYFRGTHPNFGDDLNEIVWPRLAPDLFGHPAEEAEHGFLGTGTLIGRPFPGVRRIHVFSSGVGYDRIGERQRDYRFWCVRGPLSARALGLPADRAIVDGGIMTPELLGIARAATPSAKPIVVPHWESLLVGGWAEACEIAGHTLVDPMQEPATVIAQIATAPLVITESLHGAIMADVLRIPWIAIVTTANLPLFKWFDWTASVRTPLNFVAIRPPSPDALARFGRPGIGALARPVPIGEEQAFGHFARWGMEDAAPSPSRFTPARIARAVATRLAERIGGVSPRQTAAALRSIAANVTPQLSPAGAVEERRTMLLARLDELRAARAEGSLDAG